MPLFAPWEHVAVDLIGPYRIETSNHTLTLLLCLSMIDLATRWVEIAPIPTKHSEVVALTFDHVWLAR